MNKQYRGEPSRPWKKLAPIWALAAAAALAACGGGGGGDADGSASAQSSSGTAEAQAADVSVVSSASTGSVAYVPLYPTATAPLEQIQYTEPDGTLVTLMGARPTERHARERGEAWTEADTGPGRYLTFPSFYFQNRSFGLEIRDKVRAGGKKVEFYLHVNNGSFDGTTFSLFRNVLNPEVRDYGWSLNYGFNNPKEGNKPICHANSRDCMMTVESNWRTSPHSPLKVGDKIELAPAPRLARDANGKTLIDAGGSRYYSFEQLYVVGVGMRPWYGIAPNLDSEPLPVGTLLGGDTSVSYNYSEEPHRMFQQMANNIGILNSQRFVEGRRLFHTSFLDGKHSEHPEENPVFSAHVGQLGPRFNQTRCVECHTQNGRSLMPALGVRLDTMTFLTRTGTDGQSRPDPSYGLNIQQRAVSSSAADHGVSVARYETTVRTLSEGERVELVKPVYQFKGPVPAQFSARQAPQVIGLGLLEAVPESTILALSDATDKNADGVRGVPNWVANPETGQRHLGRFGWKASKATLRQQLGEALVNDMGVTSPVYPSRDCQLGLASCRQAASVSVSETELQRMAQYMALIGVPAQRSLRSGFPSDARVSPEHDVDPARIALGSKLFAQAKCTACHTPQMTTGMNHPLAELRKQVIRPYSNLLLHDMGPGLADNVSEGQAQPAMWRTAPLWGLGSLPYVQGGADKVRYLHDGRARTVTEAILWHGGEAATSRSLFEGMSKSDRDAVRAFLNSL